jgi:transposase
VPLTKPKFVQYVLDVIIHTRGHTVVRLPPHHCKYNPIELVWAQVNREVADKNNIFRISDVEMLMNTALENITKAVWQSCVK